MRAGQAGQAAAAEDLPAVKTRDQAWIGPEAGFDGPPGNHAELWYPARSFRRITLFEAVRGRASTHRTS